jgi:hypothetical protein
LLDFFERDFEINISGYSKMNNLTHRKARIADLPRLVELLLEDELGATRESRSAELDEKYTKAFHKIDIDPKPIFNGYGKW